MARRNDQALAEALQAIARAMENQGNGGIGRTNEYQGLSRFQKNNPPSFNGGYNPKEHKIG